MWQERVGKEYAKYKIDQPATFREFCWPTQFALQSPQAFLGQFARRIRNLAVIHAIGSGKTCSAIQMMHAMRKPGQMPMVVMPASLLPGFYAEMQSPCSEKAYLTAEQRGWPPAQQRRVARAAIDADFTILSFNGLVGWSGPAPPLLIIDEVQELLGGGTLYRAVTSFIAANPDMRVVAMSATPITDDVGHELPMLMALLRQRPVASAEELAGILAEQLALPTPDFAISYFRGAPPYTFPRVEKKILRCWFSPYQLAAYHEALGRDNRHGPIDAFYSQSRQKSMAAVPGGDLANMTPRKLSSGLEKYSAKFAQWVRRVHRRGLHFTFCEYTGCHGISLLAKVLKQAGWKNYFTNGPGPFRYAKWTGVETSSQKDTIRRVFNSSANDDASQIKMVIGSSAMKTGVSLLRVQYCHILETHWNIAYMRQVEGRCVRFCSAKTLPRAERVVKLIYYVGWAGHGPATPQNSIDQYVLDRAEAKQEKITALMKVMARLAIDRELFQV
jgi:hypothetical protein